MQRWLAFSDVLLQPQFSFSKSRADVDISQWFCSEHLELPIISSNMDSVTNSTMANAMASNGATAALHRFQSIEENVAEYNRSPVTTMCSFGLGKQELQRAITLAEVGCNTLILDVAHGASIEVVKQVLALREVVKADKNIIVGNFANARSIQDFIYHLGDSNLIDAVKVGIGSGAACTTRIVTGSGAPLLSSIQDCIKIGLPVIADGGITNSGDFAKAIAAGASVVMCGKLLAGTDEAPGSVMYKDPIGCIYTTKPDEYNLNPYSNDKSLQLVKKYRGSASKESYEVQGKLASHRTPEGEAYFVPYVGPVKNVLDDLAAGLRSALTYTGATALEEFRERAEFIEISQAGQKESGPHGKQ